LATVGTVEPASAVFRQGDAAEQAGELDALLEVDPPSRDRLPVDHRDDRDGLFRQVEPVAEHRRREVDELLVHDPKLDVVGRRRDRRRLGHDNRLLVVGLEPSRGEALAELRSVVGVVLPLDVPGQRAHPRDERLDLAVVGPPEHGAPAFSDEHGVGRRPASHLLVEVLEDLRRLHRRRL